MENQNFDNEVKKSDLITKFDKTLFGISAIFSVFGITESVSNNNTSSLINDFRNTCIEVSENVLLIADKIDPQAKLAIGSAFSLAAILKIAAKRKSNNYNK